MAATAPPHYTVTATGDSHFAWLRTRMAAERTFMAWLRTAASMIGFGFTIVEFFRKLSENDHVEAARRPHAPTTLGLLLIAAGVLALAIAMHQYHGVTRHLDGAEFAPVASARPPTSPTIALAVTLLAIGVFAFVSIALRLR
jgi:putative membrane protein